MLFSACTKKISRKEISGVDTTYNVYKVELLKGKVDPPTSDHLVTWQVATLEGINLSIPEIKEEGFFSCEKKREECLQYLPKDRIIPTEFGKIGESIKYDDLYIEETRNFKSSKLILRSLIADGSKNQVTLVPKENEKEVEVNITLEKSCQAIVTNFNHSNPLRTKWMEISADCYSPKDLEFVVLNESESGIKFKKTPALLVLDAKIQQEKNKKIKAIEEEKNKKREKILKGSNELLGNLKLMKDNDTSMSKLEEMINLKTIAYLKYLKINEITFADKCFKLSGKDDKCLEIGASVVVQFENKKRKAFTLNSVKIKSLGVEVLNYYSNISIGKSGIIRISERNFKKNQTNETLKKKAQTFEKLIEKIILDEYLNEWVI